MTHCRTNKRELEQLFEENKEMFVSQYKIASVNELIDKMKRKIVKTIKYDFGYIKGMIFLHK